MPAALQTTTTDPDDGRDEFLDRIRALPPLTDEQLDSLADLLAWIELGAER